jgi:hypothetical protein
MRVLIHEEAEIVAGGGVTQITSGIGDFFVNFGPGYLNSIVVALGAHSASVITTVTGVNAGGSNGGNGSNGSNG